jgi:hypothetical protein
MVNGIVIKNIVDIYSSPASIKKEYAMRQDVSLPLLFLPLLAACGGGVSNAAGPVVRDSAGVRIVENTVGAWSEADAWRLAPSPQIDIGGVEGDPTQQLFGVGDVARLPDGRIVIAHYGSQELLFYDANGAHLVTVGGRGGGPGEFQSMWWHQIMGESIIVMDRRPPTLSFFGFDGQFARSVRFDGTPAGVFADGSVLATQTNFLEDPKDGMVRPASRLLKYDSDGEIVDTIGSVPGNEAYMQVGEGSIAVIRLPFVRSTFTVVSGETFYVADQDRYQVDVYGSDGSLQSSIRKALDNLVATEADLEAYIEARLRDAGDNEARRQSAQAMRQFPMPETFPAFGWNVTGRGATPVLLDDVGHLWVLEYNRPGNEAYRWSVFDSEGRLLGEVAFPGALEPMHIGEDFVLGKWRDEMDVEHVRLYELIKP